MLTHPLLDLLHALGLHGMLQRANPEARSLDHADWLGLLLGDQVEAGADPAA